MGQGLRPVHSWTHFIYQPPELVYAFTAAVYVGKADVARSTRCWYGLG